MNKLAVLEGLLFIVGDDGLTLERLSELLEESEAEVQKLLTQLKDEYAKDNRGLKISFLGNKFKLTTKKEHIFFYQKLLKEEKNDNLSEAALETLAIIAYNQPITRVGVDELRGIASSFLIKKLIAKDLIKVCGKSNLPGKPNLYGTTSTFLDYFGLATLNDLPELKKEEQNDGEVDLYKSNYKENR